MSIQNTKTVQTIYEAFARGDVPTILDQCTPDTRWGFAAAFPEQVPWHRPVVGRESLPAFFASLKDVEFECFEPRELMASGPHVLVDVHLAYRAPGTKKRVEMDQLHWWTLDSAGKVTHMCHYEDSAQVLDAMRAA